MNMNEMSALDKQIFGSIAAILLDVVARDNLDKNEIIATLEEWVKLSKNKNVKD